jgi:drug/metabolite transporter (DMT)-like permease
VRLRRWTAIGIGFAGTLVVVRPGFQDLNVWMLLILLDALLWAGAIVLIRIMSRAESAQTIVVYMFILVLPLSAIPAAFVWQTPDLRGWMLVLGLAVTSTIGHFCATKAFTVAEASAVMPFDYLRMVWFALAGYVFFHEVPDTWTLVGASVIAVSSLYILRREASLAEKRAA